MAIQGLQHASCMYHIIKLIIVYFVNILIPSQIMQVAYNILISFTTPSGFSIIVMHFDSIYINKAIRYCCCCVKYSIFTQIYPIFAFSGDLFSFLHYHASICDHVLTACRTSMSISLLVQSSWLCIFSVLVQIHFLVVPSFLN